MASTPRSKVRSRRPLHLLLVPGVFELRLLRATRTAMPVLAFALRTDPRTVRAWDILERNVEHLARQPGVRFVTASEAAACFGPAAADPPSIPASVAI
jgi:hypothetical protein